MCMYLHQKESNLNSVKSSRLSIMKPPNMLKIKELDTNEINCIIVTIIKGGDVNER